MRGSHLTSGRIRSCGCLYKKRTRHETGKTQITIGHDYCTGVTDVGDIFYFDLQDLDLVKSHNWYLDFDNYVCTRINGKSRKLHKMIMGKKDVIIHHLNKCEWDNRRKNLEYVTNSENGLVRKIGRNNQSGVIGVGWHKGYGKWRSRIIINKKEICLGLFDNFEDAVKARQNAEKKYIRKELLSFDDAPLSN